MVIETQNALIDALFDSGGSASFVDLVKAVVRAGVEAKSPEEVRSSLKGLIKDKYVVQTSAEKYRLAGAKP